MSNQPPSKEAMQQFTGSMAAHWDEIAILLAADRPPEWYGLKFEVRAIGQTNQQFSLEAKFGDRLSNRKRNAPANVMHRLAKLYVHYRNFSPFAAWSAVTIEQIWVPETKSWIYNKHWTYAHQS